MRKFELHLDALITLITIIVLAVGFILYQKYQYSDLLQENVDLHWENESLKANLELKRALYEKCMQKAESSDANTNTGADNPQTNDE